MTRKQNNGLRRQVANVISDLQGRGRKKNIVQRAASDLTDAATDVRRRLLGGETKRSVTRRNHRAKAAR